MEMCISQASAVWLSSHTWCTVGDVVAQPQCANPAPLQLAPRIQAAPGYIVVLDPKQSGLTIPELQARYNVQMKYIYDVIPGFSGEMSAQAVAGLRCEPNVSVVTQNWWGTVTNVRP